MKKKSRFLQTPVEPFVVESGLSADDVLSRMERISFQGRNLATAHRFVDCLVSTGANLYHDLHETRGQRHYLGSAHANDAALNAERIDRVYDTFASEEEFIDNDNWIADFAVTLEHRPYTTREFLFQLGRYLWETTGRDGI